MIFKSNILFLEKDKAVFVDIGKHDEVY